MDRLSKIVHLVGNVLPRIRILPQLVGRKSIYDIHGLDHLSPEWLPSRAFIHYSA